MFVFDLKTVAKMGAVPANQPQLRLPRMLPKAFRRPDTLSPCTRATPGQTTFTMELLRFSNGNSEIRSDLKALCDNYGLQQIVKEPTRNEYLLDLFLTDIARAKVKTGNYLADHKYLLAKIPVPEISQRLIRRKAFKLANANWKDLKKILK